MNLFLCDTPECQVVTFLEADTGWTRCPGCGYIGDLLRPVGAARDARKLSRRLLERT